MPEFSNYHLLATEVHKEENDSETLHIHCISCDWYRTASLKNTKDMRKLMEDFLQLIGSKIPLADIMKEGSI